VVADRVAGWWDGVGSLPAARDGRIVGAPEFPMKATLRCIAVLLPWLFAAALGAQQKVLIPDQIERATTTDDKGVVQWAEWKAEKCPGCTGAGKVKCGTCERFPEDFKNCPDCEVGDKQTKETVCRMCAGVGDLPDPLLKVGCPGCLGAAFLICTVCNGLGGSRVDGAKQVTTCPGCRGDGGFKCGVCSGNRLVEPAGLKPAMKDAAVKDLTKAMAAADQALKELAAFRPMGGEQSRKEAKAMVKTLDAAGASFPPVKRLVKVFDDYMGRIYGGKVYKAAAENEAASMNMIKASTEYYLKHQKRMLELAHKRAEANAKAAADTKGK
jgi:hypothetical protein